MIGGQFENENCLPARLVRLPQPHGADKVGQTRCESDEGEDRVSRRPADESSARKSIPGPDAEYERKPRSQKRWYRRAGCRNGRKLPRAELDVTPRSGHDDRYVENSDAHAEDASTDKPGSPGAIHCTLLIYQWALPS